MWLTLDICFKRLTEFFYLSAFPWVPGSPWYTWVACPLIRALNPASPRRGKTPGLSLWNSSMHRAHTQFMLPMSQPWTKSDSISLKTCWLSICLHPPISFTCLQWLEKLTLSYILAKVPFLFPPFGHESMGVMTTNLFMLFSHSVRLCLCVKVDLWETDSQTSACTRIPWKP